MTVVSDHDVILSEIGQAKSRFLEGSIAESFFLESGRLPGAYQVATAEAFQKYQSQLKILNSMDFDDLLFYGVKLAGNLRRCSRPLQCVRFRYILVDEYQDTNPSQFKNF